MLLKSTKDSQPIHKQSMRKIFNLVSKTCFSNELTTIVLKNPAVIRFHFLAFYNFIEQITKRSKTYLLYSLLHPIETIAPLRRTSLGTEFSAV